VIILDTNVISEPLKAAPQPRLIAWLRAQDADTLYLTTVTIAELRSGLETMPAGRRQDALREGITKLESAFKGRILVLDLPAAVEFGHVYARARAAGNPIAFGDAAIAAIAVVQGFTVATRDANDFRSTGAKVINPWAED
jgi:predicted nucleic acid-binding protein